MSPSTSASEVTQEQKTLEEDFIAFHVAARTDGTFSSPADGLQCIAEAERKVAEMKATAARVAASKGTKRVHVIEEAQSDNEQSATEIRSRKSTGVTTEDFSRATMDAPGKPHKREVKGVSNDDKEGTSGLEIAARKSTHEGAQEVVAEHGASARAIESSGSFTAINERVPEKVQRPFPRLSKEQIDALVNEALACMEDWRRLFGRREGLQIRTQEPCAYLIMLLASSTGMVPQQLVSYSLEEY